MFRLYALSAFPFHTSNRRIVASLALLLVLFPARTAADPIVATFDVQVTQRFTRQDAGPGVLEPFDQSFGLFMTFDPDAPAGSGVYGRPSFSPVPLEIPSAPADLTLVPGGSTTHIGRDSGGYFARALAGVVGTGSPEDAFRVYDVSLTLTGSLAASVPPQPITAETFLFHLGLMGVGPFNLSNFVYGACLGTGFHRVPTHATTRAAPARGSSAISVRLRFVKRLQFPSRQRWCWLVADWRCWRPRAAVHNNGEDDFRRAVRNPL